MKIENTLKMKIQKVKMQKNEFRFVFETEELTKNIIIGKT